MAEECVVHYVQTTTKKINKKTSVAPVLLEICKDKLKTQIVNYD